MNKDIRLINDSDTIRGFSLLELMIALVLIGVLISLAYPYYLQYVLKSRRVDALATLIQDQIILERCFSQHFSYIADCSSFPVFPHVTPEGFYSINISRLTVTTYTLTATPIENQLKDARCAHMTVNQANVKTGQDSTANATTECWNS